MARFLIGEDSEVVVGRGLPAPLLPPREGRQTVALLHQPGVAFEDVAELLAGEVDTVETVELPDGEAAKSLDSVANVYARLAELHLGRADTIVTVGGGAATDAGGFVAATWLRGVEAVHVPTTLLAAVDAAIGGKTAVNLAGKNLVGAFWHPSRVLIDLNVLEGLPAPLLRQGAAEAIKAGLIDAPGIVDAYRTHGLDASLGLVVEEAVRVKTSIVAGDFTERGDRTLLNLGHTIGHGVEFTTGLSHGESVSIGLVAACAVSARLLAFPASEYVTGALEVVGLPTAAPGADRAEVRRLISLDKKRDSEGVRMVLLREVGSPEVHRVGPDDIEAGLDAIGL